MRNFFSNTNSVSGASVLLAFAFLLTAFATEAPGQKKGVEPNRLAVDTVSVKKLGRLFGIVMTDDAQGVSIVVRRAWLEETFPKFAEEHFATEQKTLSAEREKLKQRLESWQNEYENEDRRFIDDFVDENVELLGLDEPVDVSKLQFTIVRVDRKDVRRVFRQKEDRHLLAGIAWSENIADVETTNATVLKKKLEKENVDIASYELLLGGEIPVMLESDIDWEIRKALIEFGRLSRVEFQGSGGLFLRRGTDLNAGEAMKAMLQGGGLAGLGGIGGFSHIDQLGKDLGLPEFQDRNTGRPKRDENAWMKPMIEAAEKENRRCFSVAKMTQDAKAVTVDMLLYRKSVDNQWVLLAKFSDSAELAAQTVDDLDVVAQDPNVTRVMEMLKQFGGGDQSIVEKALKSGAATKKALGQSMAALDEFVEKFSIEVDNPPIKN